MPLRGQPGIEGRDLIEVVPVEEAENPRGEDWQPVWQPLPVLGGAPLTVFSRKLGAAEAWRDGKTDTQVNYRLYADHRRGTTFPVNERHRIWHPDISKRNPDDTPDYDTAIEVQSVVVQEKEGIAEIQCGGTLQ